MDGLLIVEKNWIYRWPDFLISWVLPAVVVILFWLKKRFSPRKNGCSTKVADAKLENARCQLVSPGRYSMAYFVSMLPGLGIPWIDLRQQKQGWRMTS
jgi:cyanate permease